MSRILRTSLAVALLWVIGIPAWAQAPTPPPFYAIENAKVIVGDGTVLERGTVLVGNGLIEAVGADRFLIKLPCSEQASAEERSCAYRQTNFYRMSA